MRKYSGQGMPPGRETLVMDSPQTTFTRNRGVYLSRGSLCLITSIVLCCLVGTAFLVYHFVSCHNELLRPSICDAHCDHHHTNGATHHMPTHSPGANSENGDSSQKRNETPVIDVKLPRSVVPLGYDLKIVPFLIVDNFTFNGEAKIRVKVMEDCLNITLHAMALKIEKKSVQLLDVTANSKNIPISSQYQVEVKQFYVMETDQPLLKDHIYELSMKYVGILNDYLQGFYRSSYQVGNETR